MRFLKVTYFFSEKFTRNKCALEERPGLLKKKGGLDNFPNFPLSGEFQRGLAIILRGGSEL